MYPHLTLVQYVYATIKYTVFEIGINLLYFCNIQGLKCNCT